MKTNDYDIFKFRVDNREKINNFHVRKLAERMKIKNLLHARPIMVNAEMEVIDGQHRLLAAKSLGIEVYYEIQKDLKPEDIIAMNLTKPWTISDFMNFFCKGGYPEYLKLREFMEKNTLPLSVALGLVSSQSHEDAYKFKEGAFVFTCNTFFDELETCKNTIYLLKRINGTSTYLNSRKFFKCLIQLVKHPLFDKGKWMNNVERHCGKFGPRSTNRDYLKLLLSVHNWNCSKKIVLDDVSED